uniref:ATP synthase subunit delta, chloroplastic n=1 Tax=Dasyclonium flaccidum TaxID=2007274 RepID=A0A1Z1MKK5_9FLOR|nr:ATP synthase CF1 subunit delta [Dasyclonium flaccidum]ARW66617.1 ATP synthase CF1 subunit delta [Dasyclonium flaccidum]
MSNQSTTGKIAIPYAEALLEIAQTANVLQEINNNLSSISVVLSESKDLEVLLSNPLVKNMIKKDILRKLFEGQVNDFILRFLLVLVDRRRISFLSIIIAKYLELAYQLESITIAELSSAVELNETQKQNLIHNIKLITKTTNVELVIKIDSNLIGGFIIKIGSKIIDTSLAGKLKKISLYLNTD